MTILEPISIDDETLKMSEMIDQYLKELSNITGIREETLGRLPASTIDRLPYLRKNMDNMTATIVKQRKTETDRWYAKFRDAFMKKITDDIISVQPIFDMHFGSKLDGLLFESEFIKEEEMKL